MNKKFHRGLVVGKFSPLHHGHELIIQKAIEDCDEVILISYSKPEFSGCEADKREHWLAELFPNAKRLVVTDERLRSWAKSSTDPVEVPPNDADEIIHRHFCGYLCQQVLGVTVDVVFTGEDYGDGFAEELTRYFCSFEPKAHPVHHVRMDREATRPFISGTALRNDVHDSRQWLSPVVYASFVKRVCLLGGESTGKSTLAESLGKHFQTVHVAEYGRELWEKKQGNLIFEDMQHIADVQIKREEQASRQANRFLFCDTSPLTTLFYSKHLFGESDVTLEQLADRVYDFVILCAPDFPFVQDGTRQLESFRIFQHEWYLSELASRQIPYLLVSGSVSERIARFERHVATLSAFTP